MFSNELQQLIEASLVDGVLTDQERAVIRKRAQLDGVDPDEVDVLIEAELQRIRQKQEETMAKVRKCPHCGEIIPALTGVCPSCGYVINAQSQDNKELMELISEMEKELEDLKSGSTDNPDEQIAAIDTYRRKAKMLYGDNKKVQFLLAEIEAELVKYEKREKQRKKNKLLLRIGKLLLVLFVIYGLYYIALGKSIGDAERLHDELCAQIDALGPPSAERYEEQRTKILNIVWTGQSGLGFWRYINSTVLDKRNSFIEKKRSYVRQLNAIYKASHDGEIDPMLRGGLYTDY